MREREAPVIYIALLRGINVGGYKMVAMADLRALLATLGFADVRSVLQSGNLVFGAARTPAATLEARLEREVAARLGVTADFHVRTADEWRAIVDRNPFRDEAKRDPGHLLVTMFKSPLAAPKVKALQAAITGREVLKADGRHLYMVFPDGVGNSKAFGLVDKKLAARGTSRNWNTVLKLAALVQ
ncbi:MAG TPA: DUF1697 domain-containing protein [Vicinamibacterales bacterium]|nr:DUF1697 domain-containing protein [Vicinamibacterales bacterium]